MIYLDHAATSFPKPREVVDQTVRALCGAWGNPGRSGHRLSRDAAREVYEAREALAEFFGLEQSENLILTSGATHALNLAVQGGVAALKKTHSLPTVVTSPWEHNSVLRPLWALAKENAIRLEFLPAFATTPTLIDRLVSMRPHMLVLTCRANTTGHRFPLSEISTALSGVGTLLVADAANAAGETDCRLDKIGFHLLAGSGHKGLYGMMGAGFLAISKKSPVLPEAILQGGSGSDSFRGDMPEYLPERLEAGTLPFPAIVSMKAGVRFLQSVGLETVIGHAREIKKKLVEGILSMPEYRVYEPKEPDGPTLVTHSRLLPNALSEELEREGILTRAGYHCAPLAHRALGTQAHGAVRLSPSLFTTHAEIDRLLTVMHRLGR